MTDPTSRNNIIWNTTGEALWGFGAGLTAILTVFPLLIHKLGGGPVEIGLISTVASAGLLFPQVLASLTLQRGAGRKRFLLIYHWVLFIPLWAAIGFVLLFLAPARPATARVFVHILFALYMLCMGFMVPAWVDWIAWVFPKETRGRAFGWSNASAAGAGALAALLAGLITAAFAFPTGYALLFFLGTLGFALSMLSFIPLREPDSPLPPSGLPLREILLRFRLSLTDLNFRRYLISRILLTAGAGPAAFFAVYYKSAPGGGLSEQTVIQIGAALTVAQMFAGLILGGTGDRLGHKLGAVAGSLAQLAALLIAVAFSGPVACGLVFALIGVGYASGWVSHQNLLFETCPHDSRMAHITISSLVLAPFTALVPILTGQAIDRWGMLPVLLVCLLPTALGTAWLLLAVREPRTIQPAPELNP